MQEQTAMLGTEPVGRLLFKLAGPAITAQIINLLYNVIDRIYIGHIKEIGDLALTGVGVCLPLIMAISAFAMLVGMGAPRASICLGKGKNDEAEKILGNCAATIVILSVILTVVIQIFSRPMLLAFGASENTIEYAMSYIRIYAMGTIFVQISLGLNTFITCQGFSKIAMVSTLIGAGINIVLDPIFIFALNMGVAGAALATIISQCIAGIWILRFLTGNKTTIRIKKKNLKIQAGIILPCIALGVAPFIMQITESLISVCFNSSLLKYGGDIAVGSMTILNSIMQFSMLPLQGLTQGAQPIISFNYGANKKERVIKAYKVLLISCVSFSMLLWALVQLFPEIFILAFNDKAELVDFAKYSLRIYMAVSGIFGIQIACQQTFVALGKAKVSAFLALFRKIICLVPLIYILPNILSIDKTTAVFLAEPVADTLAVLTTATMFFFQFRKILKNEMS